MSQRRIAPIPILVLMLGASGCGQGDEAPAQAAREPAAAALPEGPRELPTGLLLAISPFEVTPQGKVKPIPQDARVEMLRLRDGSWEVSTLDDPEAIVFHKALVYGEPDGRILTAAGARPGEEAALKLWTRSGDAWQAETLWGKHFGGRFSRMRDAEVADLYGDGQPAIAVATHDQGIVATLRPGADGWQVSELDAEEDTFVHEIEIGDLDADGTLEVYATPSEPNRLDGTPQPGKVVRYVPKTGEGRVVVADLGNRHAKEILVADVDGDGTDELYVAVEAEVEGRGTDARLVHPVEIRRYDAGTDPTAGVVIATIDGERLTRFLTAGDVDGDGKQELVAAAFKSGLWLLRPGDDARAAWDIRSIDRDSGGFEHAAILADLDADGSDELYVASDDHAEVRRYIWNGSDFDREVIYERKTGGLKVKGSAFTWNIMPVPASMLP